MRETIIVITRDELLTMNNRALFNVLREGFPVEPETLHDTEYKGIALGLPRIVELLTWKTFKKVFHHDPELGIVRGWNVRMEQHGIDGEVIPRTRRGELFTFGHYVVDRAQGQRVPEGFDRGLLLDYRKGGNPKLGMLGSAVDPLVAVKEGDATLLLGCTYLAIGNAQIKTPSWFLLQYHQPLSHRVPMPAKGRKQLG